MNERSLPASPNWYCSRCSDVNSKGLLGVGAKNVVYLIDVSASSCRVAGELAGHRDLVSGFSFCQHAEQSHVCVSASTDGTVRFWDADNKTLIREHAAHQSPVSAVHWSPADKNLVVSGDEKGVVVCHWINTGDTSSFFPEPRTIFCLSCCPHSWKSVAVGYKDGMIVLIDVSKKGEVVHRLRGHDNEIHSLAWSPVSGEDAFCSRADDGEGTNGVSRGEESGCFLVSGSKDQTVRIWSTAKGKGVMTLKLPFLKRRGSAVDPGVRERIWLNVHWPKGRSTQLVSSCFSGELVMWDLAKSGKQKWSLFGASEGQNHNRIVFNMSSVELQDRELLISTSMDREIKCWDLNSLGCCWTLPTLGGHVYTLTFSPVGVGCLALGVGDNMIRVWNTLSAQNQYDIRSFWQGIKSKVTALAWHPRKEGLLSFGTDDGKVGIYDVFSNKPPQISSSYHRKTVYTLAWGPPVPPVSFGAEGKQSFSLYSCAGEGVILQHVPSKLSGEASDIDTLIRDTNSIQHKLSPHTDLSWKPDGKVVAVGNEDGSIDVYEAPALKQLCSIQQHHKIINALRWHPDLDCPPELTGLLASGSSNAIVFIHDLRAIIENPPEAPVVLNESYRRLCGHTAKITGVAWSPHQPGRLVTASYDGTAQVWDVLEEAAVSNYRGHNNYLLCVDWSPVDPDVVWTGGKDFTVHEWKVSKQEFTKPPKGKKMVMLQERKTSSKQQKKKNRTTGGSGGGAGSKANGEPGLEAETVTEKELSEGEDDEVKSTTSLEAPAANPELQRKSASAAKSKDKTDFHLLKKKKARSMLPLSTSMDHRPKEELLQDCLTLASIRHSEAGFEVWSRTVEAYVKQLSLQEQHLKAASYLLSVNKLYEAVDLLRSNKLYREAIALVKARLAAEEPVLKELYTGWAAVLEKDGHLSAAAKCYLAAGCSFDAAKVISRKNDVSSLKMAAALARVSGETVLAQSLALRCARDLAAAQDWVGAQEVLSAQGDLLVHRLHLCVAELLAVSLKDSDVLSSASCVSGHPWASAGRGADSVQDRVRDVWEEEFGVSMNSAGDCSVEALLQELRGVESPTPSANVPLRQVLLFSSLHLTRALLSWFLNDDGQLIAELWRAAAWLREAGHFSVSAEFCRLLFPDGDVGVFSRKHSKTLHHTEEEAKAAAGCLQAFVCYHRLYERWWRGSAGGRDVQNGLPPAAGDEPTRGPSESEDGSFDASVLLSEPHAVCQAAQRSVRQIQERLAAMVLQHSWSQGDKQDGPSQTDDQEAADAEKRSEDQETFLSLSTKMSKQQEELAELPDTVKMFPHPDVVECCLVLLHLRKSASVSDVVQEKAKDLLQKYGTSPGILKASQPFFT
ncbi:gem-associated protein 5 isoform X2 [Kryptolebias marmoratus]|uniref:gem-associated protein 5 isoform X2 n=1 Tax=Kryptolebias marmoratus TaxID=37003 RepID=UPI000D530972|nr:gem-associated protein 5 isoform X2 [Kryptolebias marmoratus]